MTTYDHLTKQNAEMHIKSIEDDFDPDHALPYLQEFKNEIDQHTGRHEDYYADMKDKNLNVNWDFSNN